MASPGKQTVGQLIDSSIRQTVMDTAAAMSSPSAVSQATMAPGSPSTTTLGHYPAAQYYGQYPVVEREIIKEVPKEVIKYVDKVKEVPKEVIKVPRVAARAKPETRALPAHRRDRSRALASPCEPARARSTSIAK